MVKDFRENVLLQYSIITLAITLIITFIAGFMLTKLGKDQLINTHLDVYPAFIEHIFDPETGEIESFFSKKAEPPKEFEEHIQALLDIPSIFEIKIWNKEKTVIWSSIKEEIWESSPDDEILKKALDGTIGYEMEYSDPYNHASSEISIPYLEIYIPVYADNSIKGVFEIYESDKELNGKIANLQILTWITTGSAGLILYIALFALFGYSYKRQKRITARLNQTQDVTIFALAYQAGLRDEETGQHLKRTQAYVQILAEELSKKQDYHSYLTKAYIKDLVKSAPLHDIGKVGIPDNILRKPAKLTAEEFEHIKKHCELGANIIEEALKELSFRSFLDIAISLIKHHHEKWDGTGYPAKLTGTNIPISARIMAMADVYDALRSKRVYKDSYSHEKCVKIIAEGKGTHFDPDVADAFFLHSEEFRKISETMADE